MMVLSTYPVVSDAAENSTGEKTVIAAASSRSLLHRIEMCYDSIMADHIQIL
jgi:hypothetical protein